MEFALAAPVLAILGLAMLDTVDFMRVSLRIERTAGELTNVVGQYEVLRESDFAVLFALAEQIAAPYQVTRPGGAVIISGLANTGSGIVVLWQRRVGSAEPPSAFGAQGGPATIPAWAGDLTLAVNQGAVLTEVFLTREPWVLTRELMGTPAFTRLGAFAIQRPRMVGVLRVSA